MWYIDRFLLSGADVITTATYQASITGFINHLDVSSERARELLMSGVQVAKDTVERFVSDSPPTGTKLYSLWSFKAVKHCISVSYDAISLCFKSLSVKGKDVPWWQALLDHMGPFCTTAPSTLGLMQRRWVLKWGTLSCSYTGYIRSNCACCVEMTNRK